MNVVGKKVKTFFLYMCFTFQNNSYNIILKNIVSYNVLIFAWASKQMNTQIINGMSTLTMQKMCNYRMWKAKECIEEKWNVNVVGHANNQMLVIGLM